MADGLVEDFLGEAVVDAFRGVRQAVTRASDEATAWLRVVAQPPPGVRLMSDDGSTYTGMVLVDRSEVVVLLAARHAPGFSSSKNAGTPPPSPAAPPGLALAGRLDPDDPRWDRDANPFHP